MKTILIVDDEHDICEILSEFLSEDYLVLTAHDGQQALSILKSRSVEFVITDVDMPVMNGIDLLKSIRSLCLDTPVCILTGGLHFNQSLALSYGANFFIEKPIHDFRHFQKMIKDSLE